MALSSSSPVVAPSPCRFLCPRATTASHDLLSFATTATRRRLLLSTATTTIAAAMAASSSCKVIDSHLHVWATPQQVRKQATRASPVSASWAPGGPRGSSVILLGLFFFFTGDSNPIRAGQGGVPVLPRPGTHAAWRRRLLTRGQSENFRNAAFICT